MDDWRFFVVGNIVRSHTGNDGEVYYGTKEFVGGAKVYIDGKNWVYYKGARITVIGLNRFKKYEIVSLDPLLIENVRFEVVHKPTVLKIVDYAAAVDGWYWWGRTADDKRAAKAFAAIWEALLQELKANPVPD